MDENNRFSQEKNYYFEGRTVPEPGQIFVGYSALIAQLDLKVVLPDILSLISNKHRKFNKGRWAIYTPRHMPENTLFGHLVFALKYEGVDLAVLKKIFLGLSEDKIKSMILKEPTGQYCRRIWFLYEWLLDKRLDIPDAKLGNFVDVLDEKLQYGCFFERSVRHRVNNNLPGNRNFCPLIRKTEKLNAYIESNLSNQAKCLFKETSQDILFRASAFLLLSDSKSSFAIEGESPNRKQTVKWSHVIGEAGRYPLTEELILKLQQILIHDARFIKLGWRKENGFIGAHEQRSGEPIPNHISAKFEDLKKLLEGIINMHDRLSKSSIDPVLHTTLISFGFVFIHPLEDGNGRLHRYLIHHILAEREFTPKGMVFPISAIILDKINDYKAILEAYSETRLKLIDWVPTHSGNVDILNETYDLYSYFDATKQAEFLYECIRLTIEETIPYEVQYLEKYEKMKGYLSLHFDMSEYRISLLIRFLEQNKGRLSKRVLEKEFAQFKPKEIVDIEFKYKEIFCL